MAGKVGRRDFGALRRLPSKRWQASYTGPDTRRHTAPWTFSTKGDAEAWLTAERRLIERDAWAPPKERAAVVSTSMTLSAFADDWLAHRTLKPRTRVLYRGLFERHIEPVLGGLRLRQITRTIVRDWHAGLTVGAATRAQAYSLLRTVLGSAAEDGLIDANPCTLRGAGQPPPAREVRPLTPAEVAAIAAAMPAQWRSLVLVLAWCGLRGGEALELRRGDVEQRDDVTVLRVRRAVSRVKGAWIVGTPKSRAGLRDVVVPPHVAVELVEHLEQRVPPADDALLWPGLVDPTEHLQRSTLSLAFRPAAAAAGRPDARLHDLRHTGATLAAQTGATTRELMARIGHSTPGMSLRYQHVAAGRDAQIAAALSRLAE